MIPEPDIENPMECGGCHTPMEVATVKKFPGKGPAAMIAGGLFSSLFIFGALVGVPLLALGIYMATAKQTISYCPNCGSYFKVWKIKKSFDLIEGRM